MYGSGNEWITRESLTAAGLRQQGQSPKTLIQDVQNDAVTVTLSVQSPVVGEMSTLSVRLMDRRNHSPVSGAKVVITIHPEGQSIDHRPERCLHSTSERQVCAEVEEGPEKGEYVLEHTFREHGMYHVTATVTDIGESEITLPTVIEVAQAVDHRDRSDAHQAGLDPRMLLGVAGMVLVMVIGMALL